MSFGATTTAAEVIDGVDLTGRVAVITGASGGRRSGVKYAPGLRAVLVPGSGRDSFQSAVCVTVSAVDGAESVTQQRSTDGLRTAGVVPMLADFPGDAGSAIGESSRNPRRFPPRCRFPGFAALARTYRDQRASTEAWSPAS